MWRAVTRTTFGLAPPPYGPTDNVLYVQVIAFITRGMVTKGYRAFQADTGVYSNVPSESGHRIDLATYVYYVGPVPGTDNIGADRTNYADFAPRNWFAEALWRALKSYFHLNRVP